MEGITADDVFGLDILAISFGVYPRKSSILVLLFTFIIIAANFSVCFSESNTKNAAAESKKGQAVKYEVTDRTPWGSGLYHRFPDRKRLERS